MNVEKQAFFSPFSPQYFYSSGNLIVNVVQINIMFEVLIFFIKTFRAWRNLSSMVTTSILDKISSENISSNYSEFLYLYSLHQRHIFFLEILIEQPFPIEIISSIQIVIINSSFEKYQNQVLKQSFCLKRLFSIKLCISFPRRTLPNLKR